MIRLSLLPCLALAACAGHASPPAIAARVQTVSVPVAVSCIDRHSVPAMPPGIGKELDGNAVHDSAVLARTDLVLRDALDRALTLIGACID